jgi:anthranilate/para-aminobenzoate synthase component I
MNDEEMVLDESEGQEGGSADVMERKERYWIRFLKGMVTDRNNIIAGDIIQAIPSQRLLHLTHPHAFNAYRRLRQVNPSPYMLYLNCGDV